MSSDLGLEIAIVGGGIAGMGAAWMLHPYHDVHLFERGDHLGGHTHTHEVETQDGSLSLDTGFIVFNRETYPLLSRLFDQLDVATQETNMSFSVRCDRCDLVFSGLGAKGVFADRRNAFRPAFLRFLLDIQRFHRHGRRFDPRPGRPENADRRTPLGGDVDFVSPMGTIGELVALRGFGPDLGRHYVLPLASALWSTGIPDVTRFPTRTFVDFFQRHRLFQTFGRLRWRTVVGGSRRYVDAMRRRLGASAHTGAAVRTVERGPGGPRVHFTDGGSRAFDRVIIATHADQALELLQDPTDVERELLGAWRYARSDTWLHSDGELLSSRPAAQASWNYHLSDCRSPPPYPTMTYNLNRLQRLHTERKYLVTLNPPRPPRDVLAQLTYRHPIFTPESIPTQSDLAELNGQNRTYFCGGYFGFGFHEDALRSGLEVAESLGGRWS
jgi:predicted NAD/FAD-binding protein